ASHPTCLADPRLAGHEADLARTAPRRLDPSLESVERGLAADEMGRAAVSGAAGGATDRRLGHPVSFWPGVRVGDGGDESISAPVHRRNEARRADPVARRLPDPAH